ncbi:inositol monophosphatase family protein [Streptomyces avermitilis]
MASPVARVGSATRQPPAPVRAAKISAAAKAASVLVATGFSYRSASRARQAAVLPALLPAVRDIRSSGSAALDLCWVAAGRCDAYYEDRLALWGWAAGALIVCEASGTALPFADGVVAAGPALYSAVRALVTGDRP